MEAACSLAHSGLVIVEVILVWSGWLDLGPAIGIAVAVEGLLLVVVFTRLIAAWRRVRHSRAAGVDGWEVVEDALAEVVPRRLARFILFEPRLVASLGRWLSGAYPRTQNAFRYDANLRAIVWVAAALVILEGAVVDLILMLAIPGSVWVWVVLGLHIYGLVWLLGFQASCVTRPHLLDGDSFRLRDSVLTEVVVPTAAVLDVYRVRVENFGRSGLKIKAEQHTALLAYGDANVTLTLDPNQPVAVTGQPGPASLRTLTVTIDHPAPFIDAVRHLVPAR